VGKIIGAAMLPLQPLRVNHWLGCQPIAHEVFISCARSAQVSGAMPSIDQIVRSHCLKFARFGELHDLCKSERSSLRKVSAALNVLDESEVFYTLFFSLWSLSRFAVASGWS